ncbi:MAG TPA: hypothetical protein VHZ24_00800 [Pirellulales bacterium]|jgi:hypothetical protein|nr:hypothetical protein [Pirellulales bacterium]
MARIVALSMIGVGFVAVVVATVLAYREVTLLPPVTVTFIQWNYRITIKYDFYTADGTTNYLIVWAVGLVLVAMGLLILNTSESEKKKLSADEPTP